MKNLVLYHEDITPLLSKLGTIKNEGAEKLERFYSLETSPLRNSVRFSFRTSGGSGVELFLNQRDTQSFSGGEFAVLAEQVNTSLHLPEHVPPYPRPFFFSLEELKDIIHKGLTLAIATTNALQ